MAKFIYCELCGKKVIEIKKGIIQSGCKVKCRECSEQQKVDTPDFFQDLFKQFGDKK